MLATGPTKNAQQSVPTPTVPESRNPITTKQISTIILITPKFFLLLSLITTATKSLGPVPQSDLITIVIPNARITEPSAIAIILTIIESVIMFCKSTVNTSIIGPPKSIHRSVPILIYDLSTIKRTSTIITHITTCTLP